MHVSLVTLEWLARNTGVARNSRTFTVLETILVQGKSYREVSQDLQIRNVTARKVVSRFKRRVSVRREELLARIAALPDAKSVEIALKRKPAPSPEERQLLLEQRGVMLDVHRLAFAESQLDGPVPEGGGTELGPRDQARVILEAICGHLASNPPTPTYDYLGRKVGGGSKMMTEEELADYIRLEDRARAIGVQHVRTPLPFGWKIGPFRG